MSVAIPEANGEVLGLSIDSIETLFMAHGRERGVGLCHTCADRQQLAVLRGMGICDVEYAIVEGAA
jgi:hypothetical protein